MSTIIRALHEISGTYRQSSEDETEFPAELGALKGTGQKRDRGLGRGSPCGPGGGQRRGVGQPPRCSEFTRSSMDSRDKYKRRRRRQEVRICMTAKGSNHLSDLLPNPVLLGNRPPSHMYRKEWFETVPRNT